MKIITQEERDAQQRATVSGGAKGFFGGLTAALPVSYLLHRRWPYYQHLPLSLKALGVVVIVVPSFVISAERAGQRFEREQWTGMGKIELETIQSREQARWDSMTLGQKVRDVAVRHEYGMIGGGWAASMLVAWGMIMRNPYQSIPQKIVQARMWAQGLTIGVLIAAGVLTHSMRTKQEDEGPVRHLPADHSWRDIVEEEQREEELQKQQKR
ncbi:hypothetical protein QCA50_000647 [Cerrena zonata]|uniref:HIG1 domain-containing protein n=1 Tax=Cerrena zonata TaxID=2478898 RepID=A0AAW0GTJ8_9APHY